MTPYRPRAARLAALLLLGLAALLLFGLAACRAEPPAEPAPATAEPTPAPATAQETPVAGEEAWRALDWTILGPGHSEDPAAEGCADFAPGAEQLADFLSRARPLEGGEVHEADFYPCWIEAEAESEAGGWRLRLRIGALAELQGPTPDAAAVLRCDDCPDLE